MRDSKVSYQIAHFHAKCFGNTQKRVKADPLLSPLNFAYINWMEVGPFRQFFLAHADLVAVFPNRFSKNFKILSRVRHNHLRKQGSRGSRTPNMGLFFRLTFSADDLKPFLFRWKTGLTSYEKDAGGFGGDCVCSCNHFNTSRANGLFGQNRFHTHSRSIGTGRFHRWYCGGGARIAIGAAGGSASLRNILDGLAGSRRQSHPLHSPVRPLIQACPFTPLPMDSFWWMAPSAVRRL